MTSVATPATTPTSPDASPSIPKSFIGLLRYCVMYLTVTRSSTTRSTREMPYFDVPNCRG